MTKNTLMNNKPYKSSLLKRRIEKFCKNPMSVIALIILLIMVFCCVFAPLLTPHDPTQINIMDQYADPSPEHPLGCDRMGRDLLARILYGGRWSMAIGFIASISVNCFGAVLGVIAGYFGKKVDYIIITISEFCQLFPTMLLIMIVRSYVPITVTFLIMMWTLFNWVGCARMIRSRVLSLKEEPFVESCIANGISKRSIMFHHIIPNTTGPLIVNITMNVPSFILQEAGLSFLGFGLDSSIPTWGNLLNATKNMDQILTEPMQWAAPAACILILVMCVNYLGDGLRDAIDATTR